MYLAQIGNNLQNKYFLAKVEKYRLGTNCVLVTRLSGTRKKKKSQFSHLPIIKFHEINIFSMSNFEIPVRSHWTGVGCTHWALLSWQEPAPTLCCFKWMFLMMEKRIPDTGYRQINSTGPPYQLISRSWVCILGPCRPTYMESHSSLTELKRKQGVSKGKQHKQNNPQAVIWKSAKRSASPGTSLHNLVMMSEIPIASIRL